ncbi:MAG: hypothetical protein CVU36_17655 [Betaproteobacteria bacterium HGW-Betaproteobacteria-9]|jgi:hypothetical protein|nr:MAG: hypothetical protein CVU36_17655 [Betaproteobacteria bacterium HGW-Betaproteobacteria-9]
MNASDLQAFCSDKNLYELIELSRSSDDLLTLIRPRETQLADLLAWAMDAGEGHGQGDAVFRSFLLAMYSAGSDEQPGDRLRKNSHSWHFVQRWTPARILAADYGSVVCYREYTMTGDLPKSSRPDFVIVDPANRLVIVVEIKAGAAFGRDQLAKYLDVANRVLVNKAAFRDYAKAFVALDPNLDFSQLPTTFDNRWIGMDYTWLNHVEMRAQTAVQRGDRSSGLLLSFCRAVTDYEDPTDQRLGKLAGELAIRHPAVVDALKFARANARVLESWSTRLLDGDGSSHELFRLYVQHQRALNRLVGLSHMRLLLTKLAEAYPLLEGHPELVESGRVWFRRAMPLEPERQPPMQAGYWPLVLRIRHQNSREHAAAPRFRISLHWRATDIEPGSPMLRAATILGKHFDKRGLDKRRVNWMTLHEESCLGVKSATEKTSALIEKIQSISR